MSLCVIFYKCIYVHMYTMMHTYTIHDYFNGIITIAHTICIDLFNIISSVVSSVGYDKYIFFSPSTQWLSI